MLSNKDIIRELGKNIYVYPIMEESIKGASLNLTASNMAWSLKTKATIVDKDKATITIPANDTALIETAEIIWISEKISGTYHTRVSNASKGIGHIATTLDPGWIGRSLVAVHNSSDVDIVFAVGDPFVTISFYYLETKATKKVQNSPGRPDVLQDYELSVSEKNELFENPIGREKDKLLAAMKSSEGYKKLKNSVRGVSPTIIKWIVIVAILIPLVLALVLVDNSKPMYPIVGWVFAAYLAFTFSQVAQEIKKG